MAKDLYHYYQWLKLYTFIDFLFSEGYIEQGTYENMNDTLMKIKEACLDADEENKREELK